MIATGRTLVWVGLIVVLTSAIVDGPWLAGPTALAQEQGQVPGGALGNASDPDFWRAVRRGESFTTSLPVM